MSNPGVLILTKKSISADKQFRVEDNLGESIHFHYNDIRIDLTIKELLYLSNICDQAIYELVNAENFNLNDYDIDFLNKYSQYWIDLASVTRDSVDTASLYYQTYNLIHLPVRRKLNQANAEKILKKQGIDKTKINSSTNSVVLFNDNNTIMCGEGTAAIYLLYHPGEILTVLRMNFENKKHSVYKYPWIPFLFKWDKKRIINLAKKAARKILQ